MAEMEIVLLGTSSAVPTARRGLSSVALIRDGESFLFDCGEGTQMKMIKAAFPRRKFHHIFITHLHGDHIFGLGGLISTLNLGERNIPLTIHGPSGIARYIRFLVGFPRPTRLGFELHFNEFEPGFEGVVVEGEDWQVRAAPLKHTLPAWGFRFEEKDLPGRFDASRADELGVPFGPERGLLQRGESITLSDGRRVDPADLVGPARRGRAVAYCTDTAPCAGAHALARDVDLLIHEATFGDDLQEMARARLHSTIREAATVARNAGAQRFVATHFSTRYDGPLLDELRVQGESVYPEMIMARDLLRISLPPVP
jgi:ribonuclease Z